MARRAEAPPASLTRTRAGGPGTGGRAGGQDGRARRSGGLPRNRPTDRSDRGRTGRWAPHRDRPTGLPAAAGASPRAARASRNHPSRMERTALARPRWGPPARGRAAQGLAQRDVAPRDVAPRDRRAPEPSPGWPRERAVQNSPERVRDRAAPGAGHPERRGTGRAQRGGPERRPPVPVRFLPRSRPRRRPSGRAPPRRRCRAPGQTPRRRVPGGSAAAQSVAHRHRPPPRPRCARETPARSGCPRGRLPRAAQSLPCRRHPRRARHPGRSPPCRRRRWCQPPLRQRRLRRCRQPRQAPRPARDCAAPIGRLGRRRNRERRRPRRRACSGAGCCGSAACRPRRAPSSRSCRSPRRRTGAGTAAGR